ncbi:hypothetical protein B5X24_HaOG211498 [Helicoverpa armigera]|nr:hypothetical protein B5X24_HaOG211498 [Helicoverpa armigera]
MKADSSNEAPVANGLTEFGEKVVKEMNRLGMIVDLSHVGENTTRAAIRLSRAPVVFTHSSVYSLCNHKRNVPDDIIQSLKENGGIIMVNFFPDFVKCAPNATISDVAGKWAQVVPVLATLHKGFLHTKMHCSYMAPCGVLRRRAARALVSRQGGEGCKQSGAGAAPLVVVCLRSIGKDACWIKYDHVTCAAAVPARLRRTLRRHSARVVASADKWLAVRRRTACVD